MIREKASPQLTAAILGVVENQIRDGEPPETKQPVKRLQDSGIERKEAIRLVACVVSDEMFHVLKNQEEFNRERYVMNLKKLPAMPWD
jgi:hypothetical protein